MSKKAPLPPRLTPEQRRDFVLAVADGHAVTSLDVPAHLLGQVFMPLGLGAPELFRGWTRRDIARIGLIWADRTRDRTTGLAINGFPMFLSCRLMLREDLDSLRPAVEQEIARRRGLTP